MTDDGRRMTCDGWRVEDGVGLVVGIVYVTINLVVDLLYGFIDPRVRVG